jgi:hypothetical protein
VLGPGAAILTALLIVGLVLEVSILVHLMASPSLIGPCHRCSEAVATRTVPFEPKLRKTEPVKGSWLPSKRGCENSCSKA